MAGQHNGGSGGNVCLFLLCRLEDPSNLFDRWRRLLGNTGLVTHLVAVLKSQRLTSPIPAEGCFVPHRGERASCETVRIFGAGKSGHCRFPKG